MGITSTQEALLRGTPDVVELVWVLLRRVEMKITLIHCYSDFNKGDIGIILGTIQVLRDTFPECVINAVSTFEENDPKFETDHDILKRYVDNLYPAVVGRVYSPSGSWIKLTAKVLYDLPKTLIIMSNTFWALRKLFLSPADRRVCDILSESDLVVSKGGSFLCSKPGAISIMRFLRIICTLILALRLNSRVIIWGQSLGPVHGILCRRIMNRALAQVYRIILREDQCLKQYPYIQCPSASTIIGHDLAFNMKMVIGDISNILLPSRKYIGVTVKRFENRVADKQYSRVMSQTIEHLICTHQCHVVIIPHVTINDDLSKGFEIYSLIDDRFKDRVVLLTADYSVPELLSIYRRIHLLLGTRLHSTIFAMSMGTPAINISYHGTKSQGVFRRLALEHFVLHGETLQTEDIIWLVDKVLSQGFNRDSMLRKMDDVRAENLRIAATICTHLTTSDVANQHGRTSS